MPISVTFNQLPATFDSVLVLPFVGDQLVYVKNTKRQWELPGGKREAGERVADTALRETYEESGARLFAHTIKAIGYYVLPNGHTTVIVTAEVAAFDAIPAQSEISERQVRATPLPTELLSFQDNVYPDICSHLRWGQ